MRTVLEHLSWMARNNLWANARLLAACGALPPGAFGARRTGFFPSLSLTLNHVLIVDWYYLDALEAGGRGRALFAEREPFPLVADLAPAQAAADARLVAFCDALTPEAALASVAIDRGAKGRTVERVDRTLLHLFQHQIHHRGQAHAMLAGTTVAPPQLDDFFLAFERDPAAAACLAGAPGS